MVFLKSGGRAFGHPGKRRPKDMGSKAFCLRFILEFPQNVIKK